MVLFRLPIYTKLACSTCGCLSKSLDSHCSLTESFPAENNWWKWRQLTEKAAKADVSVETGWWWRGGGEKAEAGRDIFKGPHQDDKLTMKVRRCTSDRWDQLISKEWLQEIESWWWWWSDKLTSWLNSQSFISSKPVIDKLHFADDVVFIYSL